MTDFEAGKGKYEGWSERKREALMARLFRRINETAGFGIAFALNLHDYETQNGRTRGGGKPYYFCATAIIGMVARKLTDLGIDEQVLYVFESGGEGEGEFVAGMARIAVQSEKFRQKFHIYSVMPGTKNNFRLSTQRTSWHGK